MAQKAILTQQKIQNEIQSFIRLLRNEGISVSKILVFGSYAKGNAQPWSDIDLAVISPQFRHNLFDQAVKLKALVSQIDPLIEPHPFSPQDFASKHPLIVEIKKYGKPLKITAP